MTTTPGPLPNRHVVIGSTVYTVAGEVAAAIEAEARTDVDREALATALHLEDCAPECGEPTGPLFHRQADRILAYLASGATSSEPYKWTERHAEARADVDGLVARLREALRKEHGHYESIKARYYAPENGGMATRYYPTKEGCDVCALLAGDKAEAPPGANIPQFWSADK